MWFSTKHTELNSVFSQVAGKTITANNVVLQPLILLVLGAAGVVLGIIKSDSEAVSLLPLAPKILPKSYHSPWIMELLK